MALTRFRFFAAFFSQQIKTETAQTLGRQAHKAKSHFLLCLFLCFLLALCSQKTSAFASEAAMQTQIVRTSLDISPIIEKPDMAIALEPFALKQAPPPELPLNAESVLFPTNAKAFTPFSPWQLQKDVQPMWFRTRLSPYAKDLVPPLVLDLRSIFVHQISGEAKLWYLPNGKENASVPQAIEPDLRGFYPLPDMPQGMSLFIELPNPPNIGFAPVIRASTSLNAIDQYGLPAALIVLALLLLIALVRGLWERKEWRLWSSVYVGALFVSALWGTPRIQNNFIDLWDLPALLAPSLALLFLPHIARHMMRTREFAPKMDVYLILCTFPSFVVLVIPFIPDQVWSLSLLPLWPLGLLLMLPALLLACLRRLAGAKSLLLSTISLPLGLWPLLTGLGKNYEGLLPYGLLSLMPILMGILSASLLVIGPGPKILQGAVRKNKAGNKKKDEEQGGLAINAGASPQKHLQAKKDFVQRSEGTNNIAVPHLTSTLAMNKQEAKSAAMSLKAPTQQRGQILEASLKEVFNKLFQVLVSIEQHSISQELAKELSALTDIGKRLATYIQNGMQGNFEALPAPQEYEDETFDLHELFLRVHGDVCEKAEQKNVALAWFTAPHLLQTYKGPKKLLEEVLLELLQSAVHATSRGLVRVRAQRMPESTDPAHLCFIVSDTGAGGPPIERNPFAYSKLWELTAQLGGEVSMHSGPQGTHVTFSLQLQAVYEQDKEYVHSLGLKPLRLLVVSNTQSTRELLAYYLDELPHAVQEAKSASEGLALYLENPQSLLILDGEMRIEDIIESIGKIRAYEGENTLPLAPILAIAEGEAQAELLLQAGSSHVLLKPISRTDLRHLVLRMAPVRQSAAESFTPLMSEIESEEEHSLAVDAVAVKTDAPIDSPSEEDILELEDILPAESPLSLQPEKAASLDLQMPKVAPQKDETEGKDTENKNIDAERESFTWRDEKLVEVIEHEQQAKGEVQKEELSFKELAAQERTIYKRIPKKTLDQEEQAIAPLAAKAVAEKPAAIRPAVEAPVSESPVVAKTPASVAAKPTIVKSTKTAVVKAAKPAVIKTTKTEKVEATKAEKVEATKPSEALKEKAPKQTVKAEPSQEKTSTPKRSKPVLPLFNMLDESATSPKEESQEDLLSPKAKDPLPKAKDPLPEIAKPPAPKSQEEASQTVSQLESLFAPKENNIAPKLPTIPPLQNEPISYDSQSGQGNLTPVSEYLLFGKISSTVSTKFPESLLPEEKTEAKSQDSEPKEESLSVQGIAQEIHKALEAQDFAHIRFLADRLAQRADEEGQYETRGYSTRLAEAADEKDVLAIERLLEGLLL